MSGIIDLIGERARDTVLDTLEVSSTFGSVVRNAASQIDRPAEVLTKFESLVSKMPPEIPGGQLLGTLKAFTGNGPVMKEVQPYAKAVVDAVLPRIMDDSMLTRDEIVGIAATVGNTLNTHKPDPALVSSASDTLKRLGIEDKDGTLATGLAKASVTVAVQAQSLQAQTFIHDRLQTVTPATRLPELP